jgi:hypothetical protein
MAEKMQREKPTTVRLNEFELELLRLVEEEPYARMASMKPSRALQYGLLMAAYQRCGAAAVAKARKKFKLSFDDVKDFYMEPEDSLRELEKKFMEVDGIVSAEK